MDKAHIVITRRGREADMDRTTTCLDCKVVPSVLRSAPADRLILCPLHAAAPEMLAELKDAVRMLDSLDKEPDALATDRRRLRALLATIEGR